MVKPESMKHLYARAGGSGIWFSSEMVKPYAIFGSGHSSQMGKVYAKEEKVISRRWSI
jgi:hypothetical protein